MSNAEIVGRTLAALREGDLDTVRASVTEDFVWHIPGASPIAGDAHGAEAWSRKFTTLVDMGLKPEIQAVLEGADHAAFLQRNRAQIDGHSLDVAVVNVFTLADGKLARMDTYFADQAALDGFWSAVLPDGLADSP